ncbi:MAG: preprotein translocase subunit SecG [Spirochaetales bacterium]|nr:preprotein translocase subunit SecG [Spirochaetales bacterium]
MAILSGFLLVTFIISAVLLVIIVLMQDEQGEGLGGIFGGGGAAPVGNRSGNILTKATTIIAAVFLISVVGFAYVNRSPETANIEAAARQLENETGGTLQWWNVDEPVELPDGSTDSSEGGTESATSEAPAALETSADEETAQEGD